MQPLFQTFLKKVFRESGEAAYPPSIVPEKVTWPGLRPKGHKPGRLGFPFHLWEERGLSVPVYRIQKNHPQLRVVSFCVGENLFFRAVTSQVSSAPASLTSVFGMGTGGPSRQSTPTIQFAASLDSFNIIPQPFENCKPFFKIFRKNFAAKAAGLEKRLSQIVLNRANAGQRLSKTNEEPSLSTLSYPASHRGHKASVLLRVKRAAASAPRIARGAATAATADRQLAFHSG